jgi:hypothetical protein
MTNSGPPRWSAARALLFAALLGAACATSQATPVARGEYYAAGHPDYDEFFVSLYRQQLDTAKALELERSARAELAKGVGAKSDEAKQLSPLVKQRADTLERQGLKVVVAPGKEPPVEIQGEPDGEQRAFLQSLSASTAKLGSVVAATTDTAAVDRLRSRISELEQRTDATFWSEGAGKRSEVKRNLSDAQKLLVVISDSRKELAERSGALLHELEAAFPAPAAAAPVAAEPAAKPKSKKRFPRRTSSAQPATAAKPAAPKPAPAAPKPAAPKPDFEP